jgi:hypothetical protein
MLKCSRCGLEKDVQDFRQNKIKRDAYCLSCRSEYSKARYAETRKLRIQQNNVTKTARRERNAQIILDYLLVHPCVDCGESDPIVLEFDHTNDNKKDNVSNIASYASITKLNEEMAKCTIRCANCHRRRHATEGNWRLFRLVQARNQ